MQPKIAYLINENSSWDEEPSWKFYTEDDAPEWLINRGRPGSVKRIVYWVIDEQFV